MNYSIYAESTPNPEVMKFVSNRMLADKSVEVLSSEEGKEIPLVNEIFKLPFVKSVFISSNFVSITKIDNVDWQTIALQLRMYIADYLNSIDIINHTETVSGKKLEKNNVISNKNKEKEKIFEGTEKEIADLLDEYIRPAVEGDGGSITLHSFKDGIVSVILSGACNGCPSSTVTLKQGIEGLLKQKMGDKIKEVVAK